MRYGVFERDVASVQADAAVGIAARSAIFQVAVDGRKGVGQLAAYLMVSACVQIDFDQGVALRRGDVSAVEQGLLGPLCTSTADVRFVLLFVAPYPMFQRRPLHRYGPAQCCCREQGMVGLVHGAFLEHFAQTRQRFASLRKDHDAADGAVQSVRYAQEYIARLSIFFLQIGFDDLGQWGVARFVALHDFARGFVDDDDVIVFVEYGHCGLGVMD